MMYELHKYWVDTFLLFCKKKIGNDWFFMVSNLYNESLFLQCFCYILACWWNLKSWKVISLRGSLSWQFFLCFQVKLWYNCLLWWITIKGAINKKLTMAKVSEGGGVGGGGDEQELKLKKWSCQGHFGNSVVLLKLVKLRRDVAERDIKNLR